MKKLIVLVVVMMASVCVPSGYGGEFWKTADKVFYRVDDDGGWYRSEDAGKTWKVLLAPVRTTGVNEQATEKSGVLARLSPNPVSEVLRIEMLGTAKERPEVRLVDVLGHAVNLADRMKVDVNGLLTVGVSDLARGAYTLVLESSGRKASYHVILQ